jgi:hypothetical protein
MTAWKYAHIGMPHQPFEINGLNVWTETWRPLESPPLRLPHPAYPNQIHDYEIYEIGDPVDAVTFAAGELSNMVWGFYLPV